MAIELTNSPVYELDVHDVLDVYEAHRNRLIEQLAELSPSGWKAPSRCANWTVQDVVRHLCAINTLGLDDTRQSPFENFDPRITPNDWMRETDGEDPGQTLDRFRTTSPDFFARNRSVADTGVDHLVAVPFGHEPWQVMVLHGFWDSWVHERDIALPLGLEHRTDAAGIRYASTYALFISAAVASLFGKPVVGMLALSGLGAGTCELRCDDGIVTVRAAGGGTGGVDAMMLADALAGRVAHLPDVPPALWSLADFFNTPV